TKLINLLLKYIRDKIMQQVALEILFISNYVSVCHDRMQVTYLLLILWNNLWTILLFPYDRIFEYPDQVDQILRALHMYR
ncbi:hypothetical protein L9F63_001950, partial [Diploptera punctata]